MDIWSYGVLLWELLNCEIPYRDVDSSAIIWGVGSNSLTLPIPSTCPPAFASLIATCWSAAPRNRPSFRQLLADLETASSELEDVEAGHFYAVQLQWREEIRGRLKAMMRRRRSSSAGLQNSAEGGKFVREGVDGVLGPLKEEETVLTLENLVAKRQDELLHATAIREEYERKRECANNLYMELMTCMLKLEQRERALIQRETEVASGGGKSGHRCTGTSTTASNQHFNSPQHHQSPMSIISPFVEKVPPVFQSRSIFDHHLPYSILDQRRFEEEERRTSEEEEGLSAEESEYENCDGQKRKSHHCHHHHHHHHQHGPPRSPKSPAKCRGALPGAFTSRKQICSCSPEHCSKAVHSGPNRKSRSTSTSSSKVVTIISQQPLTSRSSVISTVDQQQQTSSTELTIQHPAEVMNTSTSTTGGELSSNEPTSRQTPRPSALINSECDFRKRKQHRTVERSTQTEVCLQSLYSSCTASDSSPLTDSQLNQQQQKDINISKQQNPQQPSLDKCTSTSSLDGLVNLSPIAYSASSPHSRLVPKMSTTSTFDSGYGDYGYQSCLSTPSTHSAAGTTRGCRFDKSPVTPGSVKSATFDLSLMMMNDFDENEQEASTTSTTSQLSAKTGGNGSNGNFGTRIKARQTNSNTLPSLSSIDENGGGFNEQDLENCFAKNSSNAEMKKMKARCQSAKTVGKNEDKEEGSSQSTVKSAGTTCRQSKKSCRRCRSKSRKRQTHDHRRQTKVEKKVTELNTADSSSHKSSSDTDVSSKSENEDVPVDDEEESQYLIGGGGRRFRQAVRRFTESSPRYCRSLSSSSSSSGSSSGHVDEEEEDGLNHEKVAFSKEQEQLVKAVAVKT